MKNGLSVNDNEHMFKAILEAAPDAMIIINNQGEIILANAQVQNLFGYSKEEILHQQIEILIPVRFREKHPHYRDEYFKDPHFRPMGIGLDLYGLHKDGHEFPVEISLSPLRTVHGILGLAAIRDITERKRFEQTLREKNVELEKANLAKDRFLATMSHELRTPLNAIIGFTGTLLMRLPGSLNDEQEKQLKTVQSSARHLLSLINDLLDLAKIESGKIELRLESVDCKKIINEVITTLIPLCQNKKLELRCNLPPEDIILQTDQRALTQIILNLANNAIKFTEHGFVEIKAFIQGDNVLIQVEDTGTGINTADQEKLFQAFQQFAPNIRHEGTGLGLHLSQKLAGLINGKIEYRRRSEQGSCFTIILPKG